MLMIEDVGKGYMGNSELSLQIVCKPEILLIS